MSLALSKKALNQLLKDNKKKSKINTTSTKPLTKKINDSLANKEIKDSSIPTVTAKKIKKKKSIAGTASSLRKFKKNQIKQNIEYKERERYIEEVSINPLKRLEREADIEAENEDLNFSYFTTSLSSDKQKDNIKEILSYMKKEKKGKPKNIEKDDDYYNNDSD
ncbi:hypothetical protein BCR32DRAFT_295886 [Anaeromyces robustus]|uniref:Uncharacterized protein n=1 Tax=Anaeromyces robustus TaxID=1754192 RepID=A0A1Y1WU14_9FUNG|nr:hypothetical protein BCR32DRAFT_295886 [Anaeromyces robustus]|eukprot:ORX77003.1 hypothetical protein BCR32DRAFT_295886 [Anaeromyces robustus]